jgi:hypothetical protein
MSTLRTPRESKTSPKGSSNPGPVPTPEEGTLTLSPAEAVPNPAISYEETAARAYALFLGRGGQPGDEWGDWFQAEAELRREKERADRPVDQ